MSTGDMMGLLRPRLKGLGLTPEKTEDLLYALGEILADLEVIMPGLLSGRVPSRDDTLLLIQHAIYHWPGHQKEVAKLERLLPTNASSMLSAARRKKLGLRPLPRFVERKRRAGGSSVQRIQKLQKGKLERLESLAKAGDLDAQIAAAQSWEKRLVRGAKARAFKWWLRAAESGDAGAQYQVSWCYRDGVGIQQSDERALLWIRRAAAQRHSDAEYSMGWMYSNGEGVAQSKRTAARWYFRAARHGSIEGMFNAAFFLERGIGTRKNWSRAAALYRRAAQLGDKDAKHNLKLMVRP